MSVETLVPATTSFVHYAIYIGTLQERTPVSFGTFRRDAMFFKTLALTQLLGLYVWHFDHHYGSLALVVTGFGLPSACGEWPHRCCVPWQYPASELNNTHGWQREPTDPRLLSIRGFALPSVGPSQPDLRAYGLRRHPGNHSLGPVGCGVHRSEQAIPVEHDACSPAIGGSKSPSDFQKNHVSGPGKAGC
ncbi:hypothetical protein CKO51_22210 [Rhodopirellula sp. SM50]|nr:hypothetical protein [Rhodopirellula sp. SM50]PAY17338.1 hypothetical protein CKO51_22210 [Rhodopirellula sp. SM50]